MEGKEYLYMFKWGKRIFLFLAVNVLVMVTLSFVLNILGVKPYLTQNGINYGSLMVFCLVWGMGGAFISLALSRVMAKWMMGVQIIQPNTHNPAEQELVQTVHRLSRAAGLQTMPEVGIYDSPEVNAFATGPTRNRALVAVSSGLLRNMDKRSVEGVLAHEVAHVANGDMVTMALIQGVVNAFVMFLARVIAFAISNLLRSRDEEGEGLGPFAHMMVVFVLETIFMILGSIVVAAFSRYREFRADAGGAKLGGRDAMISALKSLQRVYEHNQAVVAHAGNDNRLQTMKISGGPSWMKLFASHPSLDERIARLEMAKF